jgi:hypothetical protein
VAKEEPAVTVVVDSIQAVEDARAMNNVGVLDDIGVVDDVAVIDGVALKVTTGALLDGKVPP